MKKINFFQMVVLTIFTFAACTNAPESDKAKTSEAKEVSENTAGETFKIDLSSSKIEFVGTKVSSYHTGSVQIKNGDLQVKDGNISGGKFVMDMNSIVVSGPEGSKEDANNKLMGHLKSADFFDVTSYPEATFEITGAKPFSGSVTEQDDPRQADISEYKVTNPTHTVSGNLTIKGIAKNIEFPAQITMTDNTAEAIAKFNIDRTQWNLVYTGKPDDLIRNEIHLGIVLKTIK